MAKILRALNYAHQRGVIHGNVCPRNVMVTPDDDCKLVGFDLTIHIPLGYLPVLPLRLRENSSFQWLSFSGAGQYKVDGLIDVWSSGVTLYQLLTYHHPFEGHDKGSMLINILSENPPPLSTYLNCFHPPELDDIVGRALAKDREARYATAEDFALDLDHVEELLKTQIVSE